MAKAHIPSKITLSLLKKFSSGLMSFALSKRLRVSFLSSFGLHSYVFLEFCNLLDLSLHVVVRFYHNCHLPFCTNTQK